MATITPEQRQAVAAAGEGPVELIDPHTGSTYFLIRLEEYERLRQLSLADADRREYKAWAEVARNARGVWVKENGY